MDEHFYDKIILIVLMVLGSLLTFQTIVLFTIAENARDIKHLLEKTSQQITEKGSEYGKYPPSKSDYNSDCFLSFDSCIFFFTQDNESSKMLQGISSFSQSKATMIFKK